MPPRCPSVSRLAALVGLTTVPLLGGCAQFVDDPRIIDAGGFPDFRTEPTPPTQPPTQPPTGSFDDARTDETDADALDARVGPDFDGGPATAPPTAPPTQPALDDHAFCVSETNRYRAQVGKPPVRQAQNLEVYATEGAQEDHSAQSPHGHFQRTGGGGFAFAENACPGWLGWNVQGTVQATIANCLAAFFSEGPGGGHYENMIGNYGSVGCGWYVDANQSITIVQDFGQ